MVISYGHHIDLLSHKASQGSVFVPCHDGGGLRGSGSLGVRRGLSQGAPSRGATSGTAAT